MRMLQNAWIPGLTLLLALTPAAWAQTPYIGYVYPAGGRQGSTFQIRLGGQNIEDIKGVLVSGSGVSGRLSENYRRLSNEELQLLNEQVHLLRRETMSDSARAMLVSDDKPAMMSETMMHMEGGTNAAASAMLTPEAVRELIGKIERRTSEFVQTPACAAIASLMLFEVTIAPDAEPGEHEIRLITRRGVSNPLPFHVGQLPEQSRPPMLTAVQQVLGKEAQALRKQAPGPAEDHITVPCTVNGQIASGEVNRYWFAARRGQRLVITTLGRQLVPFIADAVPGWFQPVLTLLNAQGKEVAYSDDYKFKPDPTLYYEVAEDGDYVFSIRDSLYRGREDFVYRITIGELPFITSLFPLGGKVGAPTRSKMKGWNLEKADLASPPPEAGPGIYALVANKGGFRSNRMPFALDTLTEIVEQEPNNAPDHPQRVTLPVCVNGRIERRDDWDVFQFEGRSNDLVAVEVMARRLDSPLDSVIKLTDADGAVVAFNDDWEDLGAGVNTHHADSYVLARLPSDGPYCVHIGDVARQGGQEFSYRLRISAPQPDFELRVVPSSLNLRSRSSGALTVYAMRKDGYAGPIRLGLKDPPAGFSATPVIMPATQTVAKINIKTDLAVTEQPVALTVFGSSKIRDQDVTHIAVPAEDRMQAFLWRQLVPARSLMALVFDPNYQPPPTRVAHFRPRPVAATNAPAATNLTVGTNTVAGTNTVGGTNTAGAPTNAVAARPKFTKQQVAGRLRQLKRLYEEGMLTEEFYVDKVAECEAVQ